MNGPVAIAGSIPRLSKNNGTKVPIKPATMITAINEMEIANAVLKFDLVTQTNRNKNTQATFP